jgi:hypothetical protein
MIRNRRRFGITPARAMQNGFGAATSTAPRLIRK